MCGQQDSIILRCEFRRAEIQQQSTGLLHLDRFESAAISGAGDRTRLHYGAPGGNAGWQQSTGLLHLHGFEPVAYTKIKKEPAGSFFTQCGNGETATTPSTQGVWMKKKFLALWCSCHLQQSRRKSSQAISRLMDLWIVVAGMKKYRQENESCSGQAISS